MVLQELTNKMQDLCHSGHSQDSVYVKVLDAVYKIDRIHREVIKTSEEEKNVFFLDTEVGSGEKESNTEN